MTTNDQINILIADDHKLFRTGLIKMLNGYPDISVCGEAENGEELIKKYFELKPDISLVDISMPVLSGTSAAKKIKSRDKLAKILFLSMFYSEEHIYTCLVSGGSGLVSKNILEDELVLAIRKIYCGERYFGKDFAGEKLTELILKFESVYLNRINVKKPDLSKRELDVLMLIGEGYTSAEISNKLVIDIRTVETHRTHIMHKLQLQSLSELIKYAVQYNLSMEG